MTFELNKKHQELDGLRELTTEELDMVSGGVVGAVEVVLSIVLGLLVSGLVFGVIRALQLQQRRVEPSTGANTRR